MRITFVAVLISCLLFVACKQKQPLPAPPVPVNIITVKSQECFLL